VDVSRDCSIFWVPPVISGTGKATDFKFCRNIHIGSIETKAHENVGNSGRGRSQGVPKIFRAPICKAHCAVIFAIAQLSCLMWRDYTGWANRNRATLHFPKYLENYQRYSHDFLHTSRPVYTEYGYLHEI